MDIKAIVAAHGRDARIDLFRGIANWFIFLDHIPNDVANWITVRNYGFSGAADMFIFISGYAASIVYAKMTLERGFIVGASRIVKRVWQLYAAYVVLFVIYIVTITDVAARYAVYHLNTRSNRFYTMNALDAAHAGQTDVHENNIRRDVVFEMFEGFFAIRRHPLAHKRLAETDEVGKLLSKPLIILHNPDSTPFR